MIVSNKTNWLIELQKEYHFGQHKTPEPGAMSVGFFRDFYRFDSSHVRTHDFKKRPKMLGEYQAANRFDIFKYHTQTKLFIYNKIIKKLWNKIRYTNFFI